MRVRLVPPGAERDEKGGGAVEKANRGSASKVPPAKREKAVTNSIGLKLRLIPAGKFFMGLGDDPALPVVGWKPESGRGFALACREWRLRAALRREGSCGVAGGMLTYS